MGGMTEIVHNRYVDRVNKKWLEDKGENFYPYRYTTTGTDRIRPETIREEIKNDFMRVPFPGKNQVVWGFETYEDLVWFKETWVWKKI